MADESRITSQLTPVTAFLAAIEHYGSQKAYGTRFNITQQAVSRRLSLGRWMWAEHVPTVEHETGISRHDLRPDLYQIDEASNRTALEPAR